MRLTNQYRRNSFKINSTAPAAILLGLSFILWTSIASAQAVGKVQTYAGDVRLERAAHAVPVVTGLDVFKGDRFTTGPNGRVTILLNDQSSLDLYESGVLVLDDQTLGTNGQATTRVSVFAGIMRSLVHVTAGGAPPNFEVHTPNAIAAARGTDFDTGYHSGIHRPGYENCFNFTDVYTRQGTVQVTGLGDPTKQVTLKPNQSTTVACKAAALPPNPGMGAIALYATGAAAVLEGAAFGGYAAAGGFSGPPSKPSSSFR
ncbi:MAG TPA: FecR family protein [Candidatus Binataceae bacterium]|nr:FecR family protein [Candidatus Binataceae bacterium]